MMNYFKDFDEWMPLKKELDLKKNRPTFKEREIWWCSIGINVGDEMDGKNAYFNRPVLVIRKFNKRTFYGIPLSSKVKDNPYYFPIVFNGNKQSALISHMRLFDASRLTHHMGKLPSHQFDPVREALKNLL